MPECRDCKNCIHYSLCNYEEICHYDIDNIKNAKDCSFFKDRSRFVELNIAKKIKHTPDIDKMREFHKLGLGNGMSERSIFWTCSNCKLWVSLAHKFCPNCGAKFESEQALKERESSVKAMPDEMTYEAAVIEANRLKSQERMDIDRSRLNAVIDKLIEAARFRIKRKPVKNKEGGVECPDCGETVDTYMYPDLFCSACGQALDWSDYE